MVQNIPLPYNLQSRTRVDYKVYKMSSIEISNEIYIYLEQEHQSFGLLYEKCEVKMTEINVK